MSSKCADQLLDELISNLSLNKLPREWLDKPIDTYNTIVRNAYNDYEKILDKQTLDDNTRREFVTTVFIVGAVAIFSRQGGLALIVGSAGTEKYIRNMERMAGLLKGIPTNFVNMVQRNQILLYLLASLTEETVGLLKFKVRSQLSAADPSANIQTRTVDDMNLIIRKKTLHVFDQIRSVAIYMRKDSNATEAQKLKFYREIKRSPFLAQSASVVDNKLLSIKSNLEKRMKLALLLHNVLDSDYVVARKKIYSRATGSSIGMKSSRHQPIHQMPSSSKYPKSYKYVKVEDQVITNGKFEIGYNNVGNVISEEINTLYMELADDLGYKKERLLDNSGLNGFFNGASTNKATLLKAEVAMGKLSALQGFERMLPRAIGL